MRDGYDGFITQGTGDIVSRAAAAYEHARAMRTERLNGYDGFDGFMEQTGRIIDRDSFITKTDG
jgi:hypothetical protein